MNMGALMFSKKGKILKIKTGFDPNSSSIGTDLTPLLIGASIMSLIIPVIAIVVSKRLKAKKATMVTDDVSSETEEESSE